MSVSLRAQGGAKTVAPGMSRAQVVAALGEPATARSVAEFTYLFYLNSCGKRCGMNDLVILRGDSVVDAIFRSPTRHYSGTSSSPAPISSKDAANATASKPAASTAPATRMKPPAQANDARPSIPTNPPTMRPATSTPPATRTP
jgi:outer membrane protein assembly factor BamE (lipoprotein component of BamABCDE complex)